MFIQCLVLSPFNEVGLRNHEPVCYFQSQIHSHIIMDYIRLLISIALSGMFYYFFGQVNIDRFSLAGVSVTKYQEVLSEFPPPGEVSNP